MTRITILLVLLAPILVLALLTINVGLMLLALPLIFMLVVAIWQSHDVPDVSAERSLSKLTIKANDSVAIKLTITNIGPTLAEAHLSDYVHHRLTVIDGQSSKILRLRANQTVELNYEVKGIRGIYQMPTLYVSAYDLFGLMRRKLKVVVTGDTILSITPKYDKVDDVAIRPRRTRAFAGYIPARIPGTGIDFFGVRDYRPGDSLRHINWRAVSRRPDAIFTNEFEQERVTDIGLILDAREKAITFAGDTAMLEYKIAAASAFSENLTGLGNRVSLLVYGSYLNWTLPGYGKRQHQQILNNLTTTKVGDSEAFQTLNHLPTRLFPAKSQLIIFSTLLEDDYKMLVRMRARGYAVIVISPNPVPYEAALIAESDPRVPFARRMADIDRAILLKRIRKSGVRVVDWDISKPLPEVLRSQLMPQRYGGQL